jgi:hypothetical protein
MLQLVAQLAMEPPAEVQDYDPGSWGPPGAERLAADIGGWLAPSPLGATPAGRELAPGADPPPTSGVERESGTEPASV